MAANDNALKLTFYTNHRCPFAHRVHIVLRELGLKYEEVIIDLDTPREPWYLEINPRGLVPSLRINDDIITESAIVAQFLVDAFPSHLFPATGGVDAALKRARINFFTDTWNTKANSYLYQITVKDGEERDKLVDEYLAVVKEEIEPLLKDAKPFFGGSDKLTFAEVIVAPFLVRSYAFAKHGVYPKSLISGFDALPNFSRWAKEILKHDSVLYVFDEESIVAATKKRFAKVSADSK